MWAGVFGADRAMSGRVNKCSLRRRKEEDYRPPIELVLALLRPPHWSSLTTGFLRSLGALLSSEETTRNLVVVR